MSNVQQESVRIHANVVLAATATRDWLADRIQWQDDRGDITPRIIGIAIMSGVALLVLGLIATRIETKANTISLD